MVDKMKIIKVEYEEDVGDEISDWTEKLTDTYLTDNKDDVTIIRKKYEKYDNVKITIENEWRLMKVKGFLYPIKRYDK